MTHRTLKVAIAVLVTLATAGAAEAQRAPSGAQVDGSVALPGAHLGGGVLQGVGITGTVGVSSSLSLQLSNAWFGSNETETGDDGRAYRMSAPQANLRASLFGRDNDVALLVGGGAFVYDLDGFGGVLGPRNREVVPNLTAGLEWRLRVVGPVHVNMSARNHMSVARQNQFGYSPGARALTHSPEFRIGAGLLFRPREPHLSGRERLPIARGGELRPVDASAITREPNRTTKGRDRMYVDDGRAIGVRVVDPREFAGIRSPDGASVLVPNGPLYPYEDRILGSAFFEIGSHEVREEYRPLLDDIATFMRQNPHIHVELRGYTDARGGGRMNTSLAERRGTTIRELLARLYDTPERRLHVRSYGIDYRASEDSVSRRVDVIARFPVEG